jgi:hypothetical protein
MNPATVGLIVFICTFASALFAQWLRTVLPERQVDAESKDSVNIGVGLVATMTALILGLVTASAKSSFDVVDGAVKQTSTQVLPSTASLARYGSETAPIRMSVKDAIATRWTLFGRDSSKTAKLAELASGEWLQGPGASSSDSGFAAARLVERALGISAGPCRRAVTNEVAGN